MKRNAIIVRQYRAGLSAPEIARAWGLSRRRVLQIIRALGANRPRR